MGLNLLKNLLWGILVTEERRILESTLLLGMEECFWCVLVGTMGEVGAFFLSRAALTPHCLHANPAIQPGTGRGSREVVTHLLSLELRGL